VIAIVLDLAFLPRQRDPYRGKMLDSWTTMFGDVETENVVSSLMGAFRRRLISRPCHEVAEG